VIIETKDLGFVEIDEQNIISFPHGIYGFEDAVRFVILKDNNSENPFMWMQCVDNKYICFIVVEPSSFISGYSPQISRQFKDAIKLIPEDALRLAGICTIPKDFRKSTLNLRCPVIINSIDNIAMQVILEDERYSMTYPLFNEAEG
jgi:flagellar assembly factor FliW